MALLRACQVLPAATSSRSMFGRHICRSAVRNTQVRWNNVDVGVYTENGRPDIPASYLRPWQWPVIAKKKISCQRDDRPP